MCTLRNLNGCMGRYCGKIRAIKDLSAHADLRSSLEPIRLYLSRACFVGGSLIDLSWLANTLLRSLGGSLRKMPVSRGKCSPRLEGVSHVGYTGPVEVVVLSKPNGLCSRSTGRTLSPAISAKSTGAGSISSAGSVRRNVSHSGYRSPV